MTLCEIKDMAKIAISKSILKEYHNDTYNRIVYLNNGDEFQIQLFNPYTYVIGAKISINGNDSHDLIALRPGERVWIERPLGKQRKYKFETYEVENSEEVGKATKMNGEVKVSFYKENTYTDVYSSLSSSSNRDFIKSHEYDYDYLRGIERGISSAPQLTTLLNNTSNCDINCLSIGNYKSEASTSNLFSNSYKEIPAGRTIETGRISTGSKSKQMFSSVDMDFESWAFKTETIKILPSSRKPYTSDDLQKIYCTECGRKLNSKFKFCPYCGTKCVF